MLREGVSVLQPKTTRNEPYASNAGFMSCREKPYQTPQGTMGTPSNGVEKGAIGFGIVLGDLGKISKKWELALSCVAARSLG